MADTQQVRPGLIIFRRTDVKHGNWYCRIKIPDKDAYKFVSLKTPLEAEARERARDAAIRVDVKLELGHPILALDCSTSALQAFHSLTVVG